MKTISNRNLVKRINRRLIRCGQWLETSRLSFVAKDWGRHYLVDLAAGPGSAAIIQKHIDLADFARRLGALRREEKISGAR